MPFSNNLGAKEKNGRDWAYCKSLEWQMYSELAVPYFATSFGVASGQQHTNPHHCSHDPCSSQHIFLTFLVQLTNTQVFWKHIGHQDHQTFIISMMQLFRIRWKNGAPPGLALSLLVTSPGVPWPSSSSCWKPMGVICFSVFWVSTRETFDIDRYGSIDISIFYMIYASYSNYYRSINQIHIIIIMINRS